MDIKQIWSKISDFLKKYKYAAVVLLIGIGFMLFPGTSKSDKSEVNNDQIREVYGQNLNKELAGILSKIEGAGKVEVILTVAKGEETIYQTNSDQTIREQESDIKLETVILSNNSRNEIGLVKRIDPAKYLGAIVLCQGANQAAVRLAITEAVSKITGLGADCICVLKMN